LHSQLAIECLVGFAPFQYDLQQQQHIETHTNEASM